MKLWWVICVNMLLGLNLLPVLWAQDTPSLFLSAPSLAADAQGRLWQASVSQGRLWVAASHDAGQHFLPAVAVNATPMHIVTSQVTRPQIVVAQGGMVYVSWIEELQPLVAGQVWFSRSLDGGKSFAPPQRVHERSQVNRRDNVLTVAPDGTITIAWQQRGNTEAATAIYSVLSRDQGQHFSREQKLAEWGGECGHLAITTRADGTVALLWLQAFADGGRDYAMTEIRAGQPAALVRVSYGHGHGDDCPWHGAALVEGAGFGYHLAYVDNGRQPGMRVARMDGEAWVSSPPRRVGNPGRQAGYPVLASVGEQVWLAWREHAAGSTEIWAMVSTDGGKSWRMPHMLLQRQEGLEHPQWVMLHGQAHMAVYSMTQALHLVPFPP